MEDQSYHWLSVLADLSARKVPCVLLTVTEAKGSTPREAGAKMVVTATEQFCTIGGGNLEFEAIAEARKLLSQRKSTPESKDYPLGPKLAQCCGGAVTVLLEPFVPTGKTLYLFGAGHVGRDIVQVLSALNIDICWVDSRAEEFPATLPSSCRKVLTPTPVSALADCDAQDFILVMTHSHDLDYDLVLKAMQSGRFFYLGLIGSATKRVRFEKRLMADGIAPEALSRLICPIGIGGVTGKHPREIAIAVAGELLTLGITRHGADV